MLEVMPRPVRASEAKHTIDYAQRREALEQSNGRMPTYEAFLVHPAPRGTGFKEHLDNPRNWLPERADIHAGLISQAVTEAERLCEILPPDTIIAVRGNTASGKSRILKRLIEKLETVGTCGIVNPDGYKMRLMERGDGTPLQVTHAQAHEESTMIARRVLRALEERGTGSFIVDKRLHRDTSVHEMVQLAERTGKALDIVDIEVPLLLSCLRILTRKPGEEDPRVPFQAVMDAFIGIRLHREYAWELIRTRSAVRRYKLLHVQANGDPVLIAELQHAGNNRHIQCSSSQNAIALVEQSQNIEEALQAIATLKALRPITPEFIKDVVPEFNDKQRSKIQQALTAHLGRTLPEALNINAQAIA